MLEAPDMPGAEDVLAWFGYWPTFHDAEVLSISFDRRTGCWVSIHAFEVTRDVDPGGHYRTTKHAVITFSMEGFLNGETGASSTRISFFNHQNVLTSARVQRRPEGYELKLEGCFGVDGSMFCERMRVSEEPGYRLVAFSNRLAILIHKYV